MSKEYRVVIKEHGTSKTVEEFSWTSERNADKQDNGVNRNLNHEGFYTMIEEREAIK